MIFDIKDGEYLKVIDDILENDEFKKMDTIEHHGITRLNHSLKVSYYSYKIAKLLRLDYKETARGGLLHDFFFSSLDRNSMDKFVSTFTHPAKALETACDNFDLSQKEKDMIRSHMFPINISVPKYAESWIVSTVDKFVAMGELSLKYKFKFRYAYNVVLLFVLGFIK